MPPTVDLSKDAYPIDGWPTSWGGEYATRPGGMGIAYELLTVDSFGFCKPLNKGILGSYENGVIQTNRYNSPNLLPVSSESVWWSFKNWNWVAQTVDIEVQWFLYTSFPLTFQWLTIDTIPIPLPRKPFFIPAKPVAPFFYPGGIINPVKFTPFTVYGKQVWVPL